MNRYHARWQMMDNKWWGIWGDCKQARAKALAIVRASADAAAETNIPAFSTASTQAQEMVRELTRLVERVEALKATLDSIREQVDL